MRLFILVVAVAWYGLMAPPTPAADTLVPLGATWKYLDDGSDQGTDWRAPTFVDSTWLEGPGQLGYGDGDEATVLNTGPSMNFFITYYFRHAFHVADPGAYAVLLMRLRRDDGVIVYLNGQEVYRNNMPEGPATYLTLSLTSAADDGNTFFSTNVATSLLVPGPNVLAAEIHQQSPGSSDISFDLELTGNAQNESPTVALVSPGEGAFYSAPAAITMTASANDTDGSVALVEFFQGNTKLGEDNSAPFNFDWLNVPVGNYALRAVAMDSLGARATSAVVNVTVGIATAPTIAGRTPVPGNVSSLQAISVTFSENVSGVDAADLLVNGVPAASVTGSGPTYHFAFAQPTEGTVFVGWNGAHGIADFESPPKPLDPFGAGATWQYTLTDTVGPTLASVSPPSGVTLRRLDRIDVTFSEPVTGVDPADLRVNNVPATSVSGHGAGPYEFRLASTANGAVNVTWAAGHGITDCAAARNAFAGGPWSYTLNTNAVWEGQVVINEIMYHPVHNQAAFVPEPVAEEYVELFNRGSNTVNLAGWRLNRAVEFVFPNTNLAAGGYLVVAANVPAFRARYPSVANVVGGWTGRLSNSRDEVELEDASGDRVDLVEYADEGDWAVRTATGAGWEWVSRADGFGSSLELRQSALDNNAGPNWRASTNNGTPGAVNSVATTNLPPMIRELTHFPAVPRSTNTVTILARIADENLSGVTVRLWRRDASSSNPFTSVSMLDNGQNNDGGQGDGLFGVVLAPQANGTITEFYVEATDGAGPARTWPAAADTGGGTFAQAANALFQVDDELYAGKQPVYRIIMRPGDRNDFFNLRDRVQRNATFITVEGSDVQIRHNCFTRRRGASSFGATPPTMKFGLPRDHPWNDKSSLNLNSVNTFAQVLGSAVALKAGLPAPHTRAVQVRFNGVNQAPGGGGMFGSYAHVEVVDGEWARDHFPDDGNGNVYSKRRPECGGLEYLEPGTPQAYVNCAYDKESNASESDWLDLINLTFAMDPETTPANDYLRAVRRNLNIELALRYFVVLFLMNYTETALANGVDDDYDLYRGIVDPRFLLLPHDFDQIFGSDSGQPTTPEDLFLAGRQPNIDRFLRHPEFEPLFHAEYRRQLAGVFSTNQLFTLMDQMLGDWVSPGTINSMRNNARTRINYALGALPAAPVVVRATLGGEPDSPTYQITATLNVGGEDITHYRHRVNNGAWSAETSVGQTINLAGLANGHYTVYVVGRNSAGTWQADADATISKTWAVLTGLRRVVINEVLARNDSAVNHEGTFPDIIELFNASSSSVDLSGLRLTDDLGEPNKFIFPAGPALAAGAYRVVFANNPDGASGLHLGFGLNQDGDELYLLDRATNGTRVIDSIQFGWQLSNRSIGRLPNGQWGLCTPSSGGANSATPTGPTATLKINEWLASPASPFVDDFVELYNPDALPVNLGGLFLSDRPIGAPFRHPIAPLTFIDGYGYRAFIADGNRSAGPDHLDFSLSAETGEIALLATTGSIIDCVIYGQQFSGVSQGRSPNGGSRIASLDAPTPGAGNPTAPVPVQPQLVPFVPFTHAWRYDESGTDPGTNWMATNYNDSAWLSGPGLLAAVRPGGTLPEPVGTTLTVGGTKPAFYFRTRFNVTNLAQLSAVQLTHIFDDGALVYLNGSEVYRYNLPSGPIAFTTLANGNILDSSYLGPIELPLSGLRLGTNHLAVEMHQASLGSADIVMGLKLDGVIITNNPALAGIKINEILANARQTTNTDGTVTDSVELYNPSNLQVDLSGMSFTDQLANSRRWVFPQGSVIPAMGYRVVRFDSDAPATTNFAAVLNTGFGMKASGDSLYLFNRPQSGGELLDSVSFGIQAPDWSIGRVPNGASNWVLNLPTQGSANIAAALGNPGLLKINEWMADPGGSSDWFEIYNPSAQPVDVSGLHLTDDLSNPLRYPPIPARSYMAAGLSGFLKIIADGNLAGGADHVLFALSKNGDAIGISDRFGYPIDQVIFGPQAEGVSEGRLPDGSSVLAQFAGTASPEESNYLPIPGVVINEVLSHSDTNVLEDAIELRNTTASAIHIGGWYLSDERTALQKYRIPGDTMIPAHGFRVFYENQFNHPTNDISFALSSANGDQVYLSATDAGGQLNGYRVVVDFGPAARDVSFGRYVTSAMNGSKVEFTAMRERTFGVDNPPTVDDFRTGTGRTNSGPRVGPVVISEVMYRPPDLPGPLDDTAGEFIELRNITGSAVRLFDPASPTNVWRLKDAVAFHFPTNTSIPANGTIVVVSFNPSDTAALEAFRGRYNVQTGAVILGPWSGKLDNSSDSVELARPDSPQTVPGPDYGMVPYILVDKVKYFDTAPWPLAADGGGQSLTRVSVANYGNDPVNWIGATPTPGSIGSYDTDGDGMPDTWETQYGLNPLVNDAGGDADGDGMSNLEEFIAGTVPNNSGSYLQMDLVTVGPSRLQFEAAADRTYTIEYSANLVNWQELVDVPAGSARTIVLPINLTGLPRFFRLRTPQAD